MDQESSRTGTIFAANMKRLRAMHDLTQKQFAAEIGVTHASASRYESATDFVFPQPRTIDLIASYFQIRIADLFSPDGASKKKMQLGDPSVDDAMYILNRHLEAAGFQLRKMAIANSSHKNIQEK